MGAALIGLRLNISYLMWLLDYLHLLCLVYIANTTSGNGRHHNLFVVCIGQVTLANGMQH